MDLNLNWTTIISSAVTACVVCIFQYLTIRYVSRVVEHVEKKIKTNGKVEKPILNSGEE